MQGASQNIYQRARKRTLQGMGFSSRRPSSVSLVSWKNWKRGLLRAKGLRTWSLDDWKNVIWSDESRYMFHHADGRIRVRRKPLENMDPSCQMSTLHAGGGGIIVWGMFTWSKLGPLICPPIWPNLEMALCRHMPIFLRNGISYLLRPCQAENR